MTKLRTRSGFTAVEMITVMAIFSILAAMAIPTAFSSMRKSRVNSVVGAVVKAHNQAMAKARAYPGAASALEIGDSALMVNPGSIGIDFAADLRVKDVIISEVNGASLSGTTSIAYAARTGFLGANKTIKVQTVDGKSSATITLYTIGLHEVQ